MPWWVQRLDTGFDPGYQQGPVNNFSVADYLYTTLSVSLQQAEKQDYRFPQAVNDRPGALFLAVFGRVESGITFSTTTFLAVTRGDLAGVYKHRRRATCRRPFGINV